MISPARPAFPDAAPGPAAASGSSYPVIGQPSTTAAAMRAAADLIERSGVTGLSVTCADDRISIQVTAGAGGAQSRAATVARLAACLRSTAAQEDSPAGGRSWITAHGTAAGLPVEVFTPLTVQHAGAGPDGQRLLLAAAPDGRVTQVAPPHHLPDGYLWVTDLDPSPPAAATSGMPGHAVQAASRDFLQPVTSAALRAPASPDPGPPCIWPDRAASPVPPCAAVRPVTDADQAERQMTLLWRRKQAAGS
jgi:hypothetical protein